MATNEKGSQGAKVSTAQAVEKVVAKQAWLFLGICVELVANTVRTVRFRWYHACLEHYGYDDDN